jgi:hypothetical protein
MPSFSFLNTRIVRCCEQACTEWIAGSMEYLHEHPLSLPHLVVTVGFVIKVLSSLRLSPPGR